MEEFDSDHPVTHLKRHRNVLYGIVVLLLIIQIGSFVILSAKVSQVQITQESLAKDVTGKLDDVRQQTQSNVNTLAGELGRQRSDFEKQINLIKVSQDDFSNVIDNVIKGVVTIYTDKSTGTGFIVHSGGYVVTNAHVIEDAQAIQVQDYSGVAHDAQVIGKDIDADVALLKITGIFDRIEVGNSDDVQIGEKVIAIGNPLGLSFTVTEGIVSAVHRQGPNGKNIYIQTDVTLNRGNSGGPLINKQGKVIGMNNFKIGDAEGLGFAIESNVIKSVVNSFLNQTIIE